MKYAPRIELFSTLEHRSHFLVNEYAEITKNSKLLEKQIMGLTRLSGSIKVDRWLKLANEKEFLRLAKELMEFHYDPRYKKSQLRHEGNLICSINLDDISKAKLDKVANNIKNVVANFQEN
jgi:tRNA 2-selenouridine synthase